MPVQELAYILALSSIQGLRTGFESMSSTASASLCNDDPVLMNRLLRCHGTQHLIVQSGKGLYLATAWARAPRIDGAFSWVHHGGFLMALDGLVLTVTPGHARMMSCQNPGRLNHGMFQSHIEKRVPMLIWDARTPQLISKCAELMGLVRTS